MYELSITKDYPADKYNLIGGSDVIAEIPEIKSPVVQAVKLNPNPEAGDVYVQQKASREWTDKSGNVHPATPAKYAITKIGLGKLADKAGISMVSSEHIVPSTCQKCAMVNASTGKVIQCGNCKNRDIAFRVVISVPQLTGVDLLVEDTKEIILENETASMTDKQKAEFMKHYPQICEAKALNGAIRTALKIKGTYTLEELNKPFVVAYLVPNLNQEDVKKAAIESMFASSGRLFGGSAASPSVSQIESRVPDEHRIEAADGENFDAYVDGTYMNDNAGTLYEYDAPAQEVYQQPVQQTYQQSYQQPTPQPAPQQAQEARCVCSGCGDAISEKVYNYSQNKYGRPLCIKCQRGAY